MAASLRTPVSDPSAWESATLRADGGWVHHWTAAELSELQEIASQGRRGFDVTRGDLVTPQLAARARWVTETLEGGRGVVWLRGLDIDAFTRDEIDTIYWALGVHLGVPKSQNADGDLICEVRDRGGDYNKITRRGYTTNAKLFFHCDGLDIVSLLCLRPSKSGGESRLCSSMAIFNEILKQRPNYLPVLERGFYFNLREEGITGKPGETTRGRIPIFSYFDGRLSCRYLRKVIKEGQDLVGEPLTELETEALDYIQELAESNRFRFDMDFAPGDIQILNNYTTLHSRNAFEDFDEPARKRCLLRMWVNLYEPRSLAPAFADRYNNGPRQGIRLKSGRAA